MNCAAFSGECRGVQLAATDTWLAMVQLAPRKECSPTELLPFTAWAAVRSFFSTVRTALGSILIS